MTELAWGARTHVGHLRAINEDEFVAQPPVFLVADGMGGHDRGEVASGLVADVFAALASGPSLSPEDVADALRRAHDSIRRVGGARATGREMGTTAVVAVLVDDETNPIWVLANVGDSRIYRFADGELVQLSSDHSLVQELVDSGAITSDQARVHPERNVVTRAVGIDRELTPDFFLRAPAIGERILLCSDGVHGELTDDQITEVLRTAADPQSAATELIELVLGGAARDNLTAVVIETINGTGHEVSEDTSPRFALTSEVPVMAAEVDPVAPEAAVAVPTDEVESAVAPPEINDVPIADDPAATPSPPSDSPALIEVPRW